MIVERSCFNLLFMYYLLTLREYVYVKIYEFIQCHFVLNVLLRLLCLFFTSKKETQLQLIYNFWYTSLRETIRVHFNFMNLSYTPLQGIMESHDSSLK